MRSLVIIAMVFASLSNSAAALVASRVQQLHQPPTKQQAGWLPCGTVGNWY
jgi:hypothetical protein